MNLTAGTWQVDPQFMAAPGASDRLVDVAQAADASLWVAGYFNEFHAVPQPLVARLQADGRLAPGFQSPFTAREGGGPLAHQVIPRPEGGAYVAGTFTEAGGLARPGLVRLREDGSVDPGFQPPAVQPARTFLSLHPDPRGGLWVWGNFTNLGGQPRPGLARLEADGTLDPAFRPVLPASHEVAGVVPGRPGEAVLWMESTTTNAPAFPLLEALANGTTRPVLTGAPRPPGRLRGLWPAGGTRPGFWLAGSSDAGDWPFGSIPLPDASQRWLVQLESSESGGWARRGPELAFRQSAYGTAQARIEDVRSAPDGSTWVTGFFDAVGSPDHFEPAPSVVRLD
ncbi:MAG: delta-60 repeat domain-containing protein, partial [Verrucomicrobiota bacterium]